MSGKEELFRPPTNTILVTWDYTEVSDYAFQYALRYMKLFNKKIALLNVVDKKDANPESYVKKLEAAAEGLYSKYKVKPECYVKVGKIIEAIGEAATEIYPDFVIMGSHGLDSMQKVTGSKALKVVVSTHVPFLIVYGPPTNDHFEKVVIPINIRSEMKEGINLLYRYIEYFSKTKFYLVKGNRTDPKLFNKIESNLAYAKRFVKSKDLEYEVVEMKDPKANINYYALDVANEIKADLLLVMPPREMSFTDFLIGVSEQNLISNKYGVSIFCANPKPFGSGASFSTSGG